MKHFGSCVRRIIVWTVWSLVPAMSLVVTLNAESPIDFDQLKKNSRVYLLLRFGGESES